MQLIITKEEGTVWGATATVTLDELARARPQRMIDTARSRSMATWRASSGTRMRQGHATRLPLTGLVEVM